MKVIISDVSGFCFGVKKAFSSCQENFGSDFQTFGPLIHNPDILKLIEKNGGKIINSTSQVSSKKVIIRAHGISNKKMKKLEEKCVEIINTTCPFVQNLHKSARDLHDQGFQVVIMGQKEHPEIKAIVEDLPDAKVIFSEKEAEKIGDFKKIGLLAQTTEKIEKFDSISEILKKKCETFASINTICPDVRKRQEAARKLSKKVDLTLVVGGKNSSNTKKLFEICSQNCTSHLIENEKDLRKNWFKNIETVGICSGASTPPETIGRVVAWLKSNEVS